MALFRKYINSILRTTRVSVWAIAGTCTLTACSGSPEDEIGAQAPNLLTVTSTSFQDGGRIPDKYTCEGENIAPSLSWTPGPINTKSYVIISTDYDAPSPLMPLFEIVHWTVANIPDVQQEIPEGFAKVRKTKEGIYQGNKTGGDVGYYGPCPPFGEHTYYFIVYALNQKLVLPEDDIAKNDLLKLMDGHILAKGKLSGTYSR